MKKTLDETRAKLEKSDGLVKGLEKENKDMKDEITQLQKDKKALESVAGEAGPLKQEVVLLTDKVTCVW